MNAEIERELSSAQGHYRERLLAIRAYERGYSVTEIARLYGKTRKTIYNWIHRYRRGGMVELKDKTHEGRPLIVDHRDAFISTELRFSLDHLPEELGYQISAWTCKLFRHHLYRFYRIQVSISTAWRIIRRLGDTRQRPGRIPVGGDERARNAWRIALSIAEQNCPSDQIILFGDEAGFNIDPTVSSRWAPRGRQPKLPTTGQKHHISVIGAISRDRTHFHFKTAKLVNSAVFCEFLSELHRKFQGYRRLYLILDNVSVHRSRTVRQFAAGFTHPELQLVHQPSYRPDLNPIEPVWREIRNRYTRNRAFTIHELQHHFARLTVIGISTYAV